MLEPLFRQRDTVFRQRNMVRLKAPYSQTAFHHVSDCDPVERPRTELEPATNLQQTEEETCCTRF